MTLHLDEKPQVKYELEHGADPSVVRVTILINGEATRVPFDCLREGDIIKIPGHNEVFKIAAVRLTGGFAAYVLCDPYDTLQ